MPEAERAACRGATFVVDSVAFGRAGRPGAARRHARREPRPAPWTSRSAHGRRRGDDRGPTRSAGLHGAPFPMVCHRRGGWPRHDRAITRAAGQAAQGLTSLAGRRLGRAASLDTDRISTFTVIRDGTGQDLRDEPRSGQRLRAALARAGGRAPDAILSDADAQPGRASRPGSATRSPSPRRSLAATVTSTTRRSRSRATRGAQPAPSIAR